MKKTRLTGILASMALSLLAGCQHVDAPDTPESVSVRTIADNPVSSSAGTRCLTIDATRAWKATAECDWITVSPDSGERGVNEVTLSIKANGTGSDRSGTVRFTAGSYSEVYTLEQSK